MSKQYTTNVVHVTEFKFDVVKVKKHAVYSSDICGSLVEGSSPAALRED